MTQPSHARPALLPAGYAGALKAIGSTTRRVARCWPRLAVGPYDGCAPIPKRRR